MIPQGESGQFNFIFFINKLQHTEMLLNFNVNNALLDSDGFLGSHETTLKSIN